MHPNPCPTTAGSDVLTWSGQPVLPGGFVVVERQQHDVHGQGEHPRQKQVEDQVEEQDQAWRTEQSYSDPQYIISPPPFSKCHLYNPLVLGSAPC